MGLPCEECTKVFSNKSNLNRHMRNMHSDKKGEHECPHCGKKVTRLDNLHIHIVRMHNYRRPAYSCPVCEEQFRSYRLFVKHKDKHKLNSEFSVIEHAFRPACVIYRKVFPHRNDRVASMDEFWLQNEDRVENVLGHELLHGSKNIKCNLVIKAEMVKNQGNEVERGYFYFRTKATEIQSKDDIPKFQTYAKEYLATLMDDFIDRGSGWTCNAFQFCDIEIGNCPPLTGLCSDAGVRIHKLRDLYKQNPCSQIKTIKHGCLLYAVASYFTNSEDVSTMEEFIRNKLIVNVPLPVSRRNLDKFEEDNAVLDFKINMLQVDDKKVYPLRASRKDCAHSINILWAELCPPISSDTYINEYDDWESDGIEEEDELEEEEETEIATTSEEDEEWDVEDEEDQEEEEEKTAVKENKEEFERQVKQRKKTFESEHHYFLIPDLSSFLSHGRKHKKVYCLNCLHFFSCESALTKHKTHCFSHGPQKVVAPGQGENTLEFSSFYRKFKLPLAGFYDFESVLMPTDRSDVTNTTARSCIINVQQPVTFCLIIVNRQKQLIYRYMYTGLDCADMFIRTLLKIEPWLLSLLKINLDMEPLSPAEQAEFDAATRCHICERILGEEEPTVRDHDHLTGLYIGAAHRTCNLLRQEKMRIPLFCHNAANYDSHFILSALKNNVKIKRLSGLPTNTEKFKTITMNHYCFLDSFAFLPVSLDNLASDLNKTPGFAYSILDQADLYCVNETDKKELLLKKGHFPYEYLTDLAVLDQTQLPEKEAFYSCLSNSNISDQDYQRAQTTFSKFNCRTLRDYCELYCSVDTLLLAEIIFQYRDVIFQDAQLDILHYLSTPQIALDFMLKLTGVKIELLTDLDKILFVERNIRGGLSFISQRLVEVERDEKMKEILFVDANNLYGQSMSGFLPFNNFKWMEDSQFRDTDIDWKTINTQGEDGFILEVDLAYPEHLHEEHNSFPLAPQKLKVNLEMLSPYARACHFALKPEIMKYNAEKLTSTFLPRRNYVCHFANLQLYLQQGMILEKVHRVLTFKQKKFIKPYIDYCTRKRMESVSSFQGSIFKLLSNSLFGKFLEHQRDRLNASFVSTEGAARRSLSNPCFERYKILNEELVVFFMKQKQVTLNKAYPVGFTILEQSKVHMYDFFYNVLKPMFNRASLFLTDTDSYGVLVEKYPEQRDVSAIQCLKEHMDFSNYDPSHPTFNKEKKNKLGLFKDETMGKRIRDFVGMKSKSYCIRYFDEKKLHVRTKGVSRGYRPLIKMKHFRNCLEQQKQHVMKMYQISSKNHVVTTKELSKVAFSSFDDKRYLLCAVHSTPYGSVIIDRFLANNQQCPFCPVPNS